jgi:hypothetical protein
VKQEFFVHVADLEVMDEEVSQPEVHFLLTENQVGLVHLNIDHEIHALVYPLEPVSNNGNGFIKPPLRLSFVLFSWPNGFDEAINFAVGKLLNVEALELEERLIDPDAPLGESQFSKNGKPLAPKEDRATFLQLNSFLQVAVVASSEQVYQLVEEKL